MSLTLVAPGIAFIVLAAMFWWVRNGAESAPPDPPGMRSVVEWAGPAVPEVESPTPGQEECAAFSRRLADQGFEVAEPLDEDYAWSLTLKTANGAFLLQHGFNGDGPWLTVARPVTLPVHGDALDDWKRLLRTVDELLPELGATELRWFRHEDHMHGAPGPTWTMALDE